MEDTVSQKLDLERQIRAFQAQLEITKKQLNTVNDNIAKTTQTAEEAEKDKERQAYINQFSLRAMQADLEVVAPFQNTLERFIEKSGYLLDNPAFLLFSVFVALDLILDADDYAKLAVKLDRVYNLFKNNIIQ